MSYKATVRISGATNQHVYGANPDRVWKRAVELLTWNEPGWASLYPKEAVLEEHVRRVSGNRSEWRRVREIQYRDVPEDQLAWIKRKARR